MSFEKYISELNGYLHALKRISGREFSFGVRHYKSENRTVDVFISDLILEWGIETYKGKTAISYKELKKGIGSFIFRGALQPEIQARLNSKEYFESVLIEDISEYYCQAACSELNLESSYPLIDGPVYLLAIDDPTKERVFIYLVEIGSHFVVTFFSERTQAS